MSAVADCGAAALLLLMGDVDRARASVLPVAALGAAIRECQPRGCLCVTRSQVVQVKMVGTAYILEWMRSVGIMERNQFLGTAHRSLSI